MKADNTVYRSAAGVALAAAFVLVWMVLAVGVLGRASALAGVRYPSWQRRGRLTRYRGQVSGSRACAYISADVDDSFPRISLHGV